MRVHSLWPAVAIASLLTAVFIMPHLPALERLREGEPLVGVAPPVVAPDTLPAFPGAKGYGAPALDVARDSARAGTWPIQILKVTNLNDAGVGSLRQALLDCTNTDTLNYVLFTTGGNLNNTDLAITAMNNCIVAGQTAPGDGFKIVGDRLRIRTNTNNLVIMYLTMALQQGQTLVMEDCSLCVWAHVSGRLANKQGGSHFFGTNPDSTTANEVTELITFQHNLVAYPDVDHPTLAAINGAPRSQPPMNHITVYRNGLMGNGHRCPHAVGDTINVIQNVCYNWIDRAGAVADENQYHTWFTGNYYKTGPATPTSGPKRDYSIFVRNHNCGTTGGDGTCTYGLRVDSHRASQTGYDASVSFDSLWFGDTERVINCTNITGGGSNCVTSGDTAHSNRQGPRLPIAVAFPPDTVALSDAKRDTVKAIWGNYRGVSSSGVWFDRRDAFDSLRVKEFEDSTGFNNHVDVDTFTIILNSAGTAWGDADGDGMPTDFENLHAGLSDSDATDNNNDPDADGWMNIDEYIFGMDPNTFNDTDGNPLAVPPAATYDDSIFLYTDSLVLDTVGSPCPACLIFLRPEFTDSIPADRVGNVCIEDDTLESRMVLITLDTIAGATQLSTADADSLLDAWARPGCSKTDVRNDPIPRR